MIVYAMRDADINMLHHATRGVNTEALALPLRDDVTRSALCCYARREPAPIGRRQPPFRATTEFCWRVAVEKARWLPRYCGATGIMLRRSDSSCRHALPRRGVAGDDIMMADRLDTCCR